MGLADFFRPSAKFNPNDIVAYYPSNSDNHGGDQLLFLVASRNYAKGKKDKGASWHYSGYLVTPTLVTGEDARHHAVRQFHFDHNGTLLSDVHQDLLSPACMQVRKI